MDDGDFIRDLISERDRYKVSLNKIRKLCETQYSIPSAATLHMIITEVLDFSPVKNTVNAILKELKNESAQNRSNIFMMLSQTYCVICGLDVKASKGRCTNYNCANYNCAMCPKTDMEENTNVRKS